MKLEIDYDWLAIQLKDCDVEYDYITYAFTQVAAPGEKLDRTDELYRDRKGGKFPTAVLANHLALDMGYTVDNYIPPPAPEYFGYFQWVGGAGCWGFHAKHIINCSANIFRLPVEQRRDRWFDVMNARRMSANYNSERYRKAMERQGLKDIQK